MKKINSIFLALIASLALFSCDIIPQPDNEPDGARYLAGPALEILSKDVVFAPQGGNGVIVVNTNETLTARTDRPWISASVSGNRVTLTVDRNESIESRYSTVTLRAGDATAEIIAQQFGVNSAYAWDDSYTFPYPGGELDLPYGELGTVWVDVTETPWVSAVVDEKNHVIHFTVAKSIYNYERSGKVYVTITDNYVRELTFIQEANPNGLNPGDKEPMEFTIESAWKPYYVVPESNDQDFSTVGVEVTEGSHAGRYFIKVVPASEFNTTDPDELQLYLNRHAPEWAAASPLIHRASAEEVIDALPMGNYVVGAIGVDNDNNVNGSVAFTVFSVTKVLTPYEKFLGTWSIQRGSFEDVWTIVEKEPGVSYTITGLEGGSQDFLGEYEITAEFDATDNSFTIKTHPDLGQFTFSNSGEEHTVTMRLTGLITYNGSANVTVGGNYTICKVAITGDGEFTVTAGPDLTLQGADGNYPLTGMRLNGLEGNSAWSFDNGTPYSFPFSATQLTQGSGSGGGGGGGDDPDPGSDAYGKWIGTWNAGTDRTVTIEEYEAGSSYLVTDSGFGGFTYLTWLDDKTGEMLFKMQKVDEYEIDLYYFIGLDGNYIRYGDEADDYLLARGTLAASGTTATINGITYMAQNQDGSTSEAKVTVLTILDYQTEDGNGYEQGWYGLRAVTDLDLPATLTKASTSTLSVTRTAYYDMDRALFVKPSRRMDRQKSQKIQ